MIDFPPQKLLVLNSRLKLQIFEKELPKKVATRQGCPQDKEVFVKGSLSFVEAPWQPFTKINRYPQSPCFNCQNGLFIVKNWAKKIENDEFQSVGKILCLFARDRFIILLTTCPYGSLSRI